MMIVRRNWTIDTDETTYHFNLQNGKWLMSDGNDDVVDSFMLFSTLENTEEEDTAEENLNLATPMTVTESLTVLERT